MVAASLSSFHKSSEGGSLTGAAFGGGRVGPSSGAGRFMLGPRYKSRGWSGGRAGVDIRASWVV